MSTSAADQVQPTDLLGSLVTVAGLLGFANVVPANDILSTTLVVIGIAAVIGRRMFKFVVERWFEQTGQ